MMIHHLAFRMSEAVPICGQTLTGDGLSLEADKVTCERCRRICELGEPPDADVGDDELDDQADRYLQEVTEDGS
jgi:hypothetical protein